MSDPIQDAAIAAASTERATGMPAAISMAQWALESGWGKSTPGNNCFGLKAYRYGDKQLLRTSEWFTDAECQRFLSGAEGRTAQKVSGVPARSDGREIYFCQDWFAAFKSLTACFARHAILIAQGKPYAQAFQRYKEHQDVERLAQEIAPIYATDPAYGAKLVELMRSPRIILALSHVAG